MVFVLQAHLVNLHGLASSGASVAGASIVSLDY